VRTLAGFAHEAQRIGFEEIRPQHLGGAQPQVEAVAIPHHPEAELGIGLGAHILLEYLVVRFQRVQGGEVALEEVQPALDAEGQFLVVGQEHAVGHVEDQAVLGHRAMLVAHHRAAQA